MTVTAPAVAHPLISVIVPTWNSGRVVGHTLRSLAEQTFRDFEVVVSDGASKDDTMAVVAGFASRVPHLAVDSRPDDGVYDAINRGVRLSHGRWFIVLGSDDVLHAPDTLAKMAAYLRSEREANLVYGDVRMMAENRYGVPAGGRYKGAIESAQLLNSNICQQAIFYRRELFDALGGFNLRYRMCADWAFNLRSEIRAASRWVDVVVADYAATGLSAAGQDEAFNDDFAEFLRVELLGSDGRRSLWPMQRRLLREAHNFRHRGDWRAYCVFLLGYLTLLVRRMPKVLSGR